VTNSGIGLSIGCSSDAGRQRAFNEDSYLVLTPPATTPEINGLLAVADGMGGHNAGDVASQTLIETLDSVFTSGAYKEEVAYSPQHPDYYIVVLKEILERANEQLHTLSASRPELNGMGTTATVALISNGRLFWGHAGDSRAYLLDSDGLHRLTCDHTWVAEQVEANQMSPEEAARHPRRHILTRSLGNSLILRVERGLRAVRPGDVIVLCSDGLSGTVSDGEIQECLLAETDIQRSCMRLVAMANHRGGPDNITVVAARVTSNSNGCSFPSGRALGPEKREKTALPVPDTLKLKHNQPAHPYQSLRFSDWLWRSVILLSSALLCGIGALVPHYLPVSTEVNLLWPSLSAVLSFCVGGLLSWLLWPARTR